MQVGKRVAVKIDDGQRLYGSFTTIGIGAGLCGWFKRPTHSPPIAPAAIANVISSDGLSKCGEAQFF